MTASPATLFLVSSPGDTTEATLAAKRGRLEEVLMGLGRTLVAYSGGVDSALLLAEAHRVLGDRACGVIAESASLPREELLAATKLARARSIPVRVIRTGELDLAGYRANGPDRCYHCKAELFEQLGHLAVREGWETIAYGAIVDDLGDVRPGMSAAGRYGVRAPLIEAGYSKLEVRLLARRLGLRVWDKPQSACLASRIPHGSEVTREKLAQVEAAEGWLRREFGLKVLRVRHEGAHARIETAAQEVERLSAPVTFRVILAGLKKLGFMSVEIDPRGYRRSDPIPVDGREGSFDGERR